LTDGALRSSENGRLLSILEVKKALRENIDEVKMQETAEMVGYILDTQDNNGQLPNFNNQ
jgi:hypothetical protein